MNRSGAGPDVIDELQYYEKVKKNEYFTGFVKYNNGVFSYVFSEFIVSHENDVNSSTVNALKVKYIECKPLRGFTEVGFSKEKINPEKQDDRNPTRTIKYIYAVSDFYTNFKKNFIKFNKGYYDENAKIEGLSYKDGYVSDSQTAQIANKTNQWVHESGVFYADNYTNINTAEFANFILGCMIFGVGFENLVFPLNGTVSSSLRDAGIVKDGVDRFYSLNKGKMSNLEKTSSEIQGTTLSNNFRSIFANGIFHPETLIGSANVRVEQYDSTHLKVTIFNITSLTSGDFEKHFPTNSYPNSIIRDKLKGIMEFGNTSQTYSFTIPIDFNRLK